MEKTYTLRKPAAADIFPMMKVVKKIGVKEFKTCFGTDEIKKMVLEANEKGEEVNNTEVGISVALNVADLLLERLPECENEIYAFLSGLSGKNPVEIEAMGLAEFANMLIDVFKDPEFSDFFTAVSRLFG